MNLNMVSCVKLPCDDVKMQKFEYGHSAGTQCMDAKKHVLEGGCLKIQCVHITEHVFEYGCPCLSAMH